MLWNSATAAKMLARLCGCWPTITLERAANICPIRWKNATYRHLRMWIVMRNKS